MTIDESLLKVKKSGLPKAGKGLFTKTFIPAGTYIVEYKGTVSKWSEVKESEWDNGYIYYHSKNFVIDAKPHLEHLARYANDAKGLSKVKGFRNNAVYRKKKNKIYIYSVKDINPKEEIFVEYGKDYWNTVRENMKIEKQQQKQLKLEQKSIKSKK